MVDQRTGTPRDRTALVVTETAHGAPELEAALAAESFSTRRADPAAVFGVDGAWAERGWGPPDLVLASAALGVNRVALIARRLTTAERGPTVVVFPEDDFEALQSCVRAGFDYVVPPFLPALLRCRLTSCWERGQLTMAVQEMAAEASLRQYERDLSVAHEIQAGFLPEELPVRRGWELATRFLPARQVAGDFYDAFELVNGRRVGFVVADVCDKGVGAALFMALIRTLLRHTAEHTAAWNLLDADEDTVLDTAARTSAVPSPVLSVGAGPLLQAVLGTNRYMARNHLRQGYFATMFFGVLDPASGSVVYINGGHNPPVLLRADGSHQLLAPTGPAVGMMPNSVYSLGHTTLEPGDRLFVYTDGVVEARDSRGSMFGLPRVLDALGTPATASAEDLLVSVESGMHHHVGGAEQFDDITMLALVRTPPEATAVA
ncbi:PP2C family protein-serine/threonine phosphatase [Actinokineospora auranticolor]|uniref:Sigma-B regulation protein RsbU (Phosphoserine phosphatase) n=1 Tax=Actinokineospora auranticolor TaxID=155976 RepID=A0A2S6GJR8_9PSEU|nr:PP2C family protein-serine/threonine phosphatase [Actinokineospora auranticolor]PPK65443.1 sigma-B regulation protein RsbU (phosphoserine phosphatase) [Actinokineospora auranticolor]